MKILAVDDEVIALKTLELKIKQCEAECELTLFTSPTKALEWTENNDFDIAFLDINMRGMDGLTLASNIKIRHPNAHIVFVTGYTEYAVKAFKLKATGYLVKPIDVDDLRAELEYVKSHTDSAQQTKRRKNLFIQCFGNFEVFLDGKPLSFHRKKSKEVLAYLIDRKGATVSISEIASILWEDGVFDISRTNQIHTFLHDLAKTFKAVGEDNILIKSRNAVSVDTSKFDCDFYDCIKGDPAAINEYTGEYMLQYSWAELTGGKLASMLADDII